MRVLHGKRECHSCVKPGSNLHTLQPRVAGLGSIPVTEPWT